MHVLNAVVVPRAGTSAPGPKDLRFTHLNPLLATRPLWRRVVDDPNALLLEFFSLLLLPNLTALGQTWRSRCIGSLIHRFFAPAATIRKRWPRLTKLDVSYSQYVRAVGVPRRIEQVGWQAKALHQMGHWFIFNECSNAFNSIKRRYIHG